MSWLLGYKLNPQKSAHLMLQMTSTEDPLRVCVVLDCHTSHHRGVGPAPIATRRRNVVHTSLSMAAVAFRARESGKQRDANAQCPMANESALFRWSQKTFVGWEYFLEVENRSNLAAALVACCGFFNSIPPILNYHHNDTHCTTLRYILLQILRVF